MAPERPIANRSLAIKAFSLADQSVMLSKPVFHSSNGGVGTRSLLSSNSSDPAWSLHLGHLSKADKGLSNLENDITNLCSATVFKIDTRSARESDAKQR